MMKDLSLYYVLFMVFIWVNRLPIFLSHEVDWDKPVLIVLRTSFQTRYRQKMNRRKPNQLRVVEPLPVSSQLFNASPPLQTLEVLDYQTKLE
jgi:hypothetical protein